MNEFFNKLISEFRIVNKQSDETKLGGKDKHIFSKKMKCFVYVFGILYLIISGSTILMIIQKGIEGTGFGVLRTVFLSACDIAAMVCLRTGKKRAEVVALLLIIVFLVVLYASTLLF